MTVEQYGGAVGARRRPRRWTGCFADARRYDGEFRLL